MYGKIFDSMYDGTISANWQALVTFQQMIVLCDADGVIDMTPPALARRTGIPLEIIEKGIKFLESPDPYSRTQGHDGVRIARIDDHRPWGWYIVNHDKYKSMQDADHVRAQARKRKQKQRAKDAQNVTDGHASSPHTDTDTDTDKKKNNAHLSGFCAWWDLYPRKKDKSRAMKTWKSKKLEPKAKELIAHLKDQIENCESFDRELKLIAYPCTYLNGDRYNDPIEPKQQSEKAANQSQQNITSEIIARISQGSQAAYQWRSDDARQIFERLRHGPNGVPWTGTEFEIRAAIKGVMP